MVGKTGGWRVAGAGGAAGGEVGTDGENRGCRAGAGRAAVSRRAARSSVQGPVKTGFMGRSKALKAEMPEAEGVPNWDVGGKVRRKRPSWRKRA